MSIEISTDIDVDCQTCGKALDCEFNAAHGTITVEPCDHCVDAAKDEGREELDAEIDDLNDQIITLKNEVSDLEAQISDLYEQLEKSD